MRPRVTMHDAYTTAWTGRRLGVSKTHVNDALCIGAPSALEYQPERKIVVRAAGRSDRQMLRPADRHGNPRGQDYRRYCAMDRQQQACARYASGDLVRLRHRKYGMLQDYALAITAIGSQWRRMTNNGLFVQN